MKLISWNVNGIRAVVGKGFLKFVEQENPDILCVQEIKAHPDNVDDMLEDYGYHFWNSAEKKGYSGTAIFSKVKPKSVKYGKDLLNDKEGRVIVLEFQEFFLVNVYTPNSQRGLKRLEYRKKWDSGFLKMVLDLKKEKSVIICGDLNVAHTEIDLARPKENYDKTAGYTQIEIDGFENYLKNDFVDVFREFDKSGEKYTYWSYMFKARERNVGWRIDYFLVNKGFENNILKSSILEKVIGSDHCPIKLEVKTQQSF